MNEVQQLNKRIDDMQTRMNTLHTALEAAINTIAEQQRLMVGIILSTKLVENFTKEQIEELKKTNGIV